MDAILLSAGRSSRMGSDKALLEINGKICICLILDKLFLVAEKVFIVLGDNYQNLKKIVKSEYGSENIEFIFNENHRQGMYASIKKGFGAVSKTTPIILQLIDQPFVPENIYTALAKAYNNQLIFQPSVKKDGRNRAGHPIIFAPEFANLLLANEECENLREVINLYSNERAFWSVEDSSILDNINSKQALRTRINEIKE